MTLSIFFSIFVILDLDQIVCFFQKILQFVNLFLYFAFQTLFVLARTLACAAVPSLSLITPIASVSLLVVITVAPSSRSNLRSWSRHHKCSELLGYTQLTQCIDKSRFISSLALRCYIELFTSCLLFFKKPIRLQAPPLHQSILRLLNVTSGKNYGHEIPVTAKKKKETKMDSP